MNPAAIPDALPLRDIHVPAAAWWPPAPGWWLLSVLCLIAVATAIPWARRARRRRRIRRGLCGELERLAAAHASDGDAARLAAGLSQLLRRVVRALGGDAHLDGPAWRAELERLYAGGLPSALLPVVDGAGYRPHADFDTAAALVACETWLRRVAGRIHA